MADLFLVPYVRTMWRLLAQRLGPGGRMCIFGAGAHTRWLLDVTSDLPSPPIEYIVDDDPKIEAICGHPVRPADGIDPASIDLVLISSDRWESRLADRAKSIWGDRVEIVRLYEGLAEGPYDKHDDRMEALTRLRSRVTLAPSVERQVVIVADQPRSREAKLGHALREAGYCAVLLCRRRPTFDATRYFDAVHSFDSTWEALRIACDYSPVAYHVMVNSDYRVAETFIRHRPGPVVVDSYDVIAGMYTAEFMNARPAYADEIERERYCLESAGGVSCRSHECDYLQREMGYVLPPTVHHADGCWNHLSNDRGFDADGIHVVYAGKAVPERAGGDPFAAEGHKKWLAEALARQQIHFHLYPDFDSSGTGFEDHFRDYRELERRSPYFHLHRPVAPDDLIGELARFDLGIFVYNTIAAPSWAPFPLTPAKLKHCTSNKFFDYVDAALPIIHNTAPDSLLAGLVDAHGAGVSVRDVPVEAWGDTIRSLDLERLRAGAVAARSAYDVRRGAQSLIAFYERVRKNYECSLSAVADAGQEADHADSRSDHRPALV